jgi:hypothetical protein
MNHNILQHLKNRLHQRTLRQQITRSKALTPILDAVNQAAKLEGISADEIVADFVSGKFEHPVVCAALGHPSEADLDRMERASKAAKKAREDALEAVHKKHAELFSARREAPATVARPYQHESDATLQSASTLRNITEAERAGILAELAARGITQLPKGAFSKSI